MSALVAEQVWLTPDLKKSFFVGDAAGRAGDHSCDDRNMAQNANLNFRTPEVGHGLAAGLGASLTYKYHFGLPLPMPKMQEVEGDSAIMEAVQNG